MMNFEKLFTKAKAAGIADIQASVVTNKETSIDIFEDEIDKYEISEVAVLTVKGIYNGKMGIISLEQFEDDKIDFVINKIIDSASHIDAVDEVFIYAGDDDYQTVEGAYNRELVDIDIKEKIALVKELDKKLRSDALVTYSSSSYSERERDKLIVNSKGLKLEHKVNGAGIFGDVIVKNDSDQRTNYDYIMSNDFNEIKKSDLAHKIVEDGKKQLGSRPVKSGDYEVILKNSAMSTLLSAFSGLFSSEACQKGLSLLKGRVGEKIGSEVVTIVDDPFLKNSITSTPFDDEGVKTRYKELVSCGELKGFLYNLKTAKIDNVASTGNGFSNNVSPTNMYIKPGNVSYDELVKSIEKGLVITGLAGAHAGVNSISGDFSLQVTGFLIEEGKETQPVALVTCAGNFLTLLNDVTEVANDLRGSFGPCSSPSIKVKKLAISGN